MGKLARLRKGVIQAARSLLIPFVISPTRTKSDRNEESVDYVSRQKKKDPFVV